jgi:hypothetical protein
MYSIEQPPWRDCSEKAKIRDSEVVPSAEEWKVFTCGERNNDVRNFQAWSYRV